ncbi:hypothetical protein D3C71_2039850 [compost metagenome]
MLLSQNSAPPENSSGVQSHSLESTDTYLSELLSPRVFGEDEQRVLQPLDRLVLCPSTQPLHVGVGGLRQLETVQCESLRNR